MKKLALAVLVGSFALVSTMAGEKAEKAASACSTTKVSACSAEAKTACSAEKKVAVSSCNAAEACSGKKSLARKNAWRKGAVLLALR